MRMVEVSSWKVCAFVLAVSIGVSVIYQRLYHLPLKMDGYSDRHFRDVAQTYRFMIQGEEELGGSFVVYHRGHKVVDMVGGYADADCELAWTHDTVTQLFSLSAVTSALCFFHLQKSVNFSFSDPVKNYWPEFRHETLTVGDLLQQKHSLYRLPEEISIRELVDDAPRVDSLLAQAREVTDAGRDNVDTKFFTSGLFADALFRRLDPQKRSISSYFHESFAYPLSIDAHLGLPKTQYSRAARVKHRMADGLWLSLWRLDVSQAWRSVQLNDWWNLATRGVFSDYSLRWAMRADGMEVSHPSLTLFSNARSLARLMAAVGGGGHLDRRRVIEVDPAAFEALWEATTKGYDRVLSGDVKYNHVGMEIRTSPANSKMLGFSGYGGQMAFADRENELAFAYTTNHLHASSRGRDPTLESLITSIYACLKELPKK